MENNEQNENKENIKNIDKKDKRKRNEKKVKKEKVKNKPHQINYFEKRKTFSTLDIVNLILYTIVVSMITMLITSYTTSMKYLNSNNFYEKLGAKLTEIKQKIDDRFYGEINEDELLDKALYGYVLGLGDKYSTYYSKENYQELLKQLSGDYVGIGITVSKTQDNTLNIVDVNKNGPAKKQGLKKGDVIIAVNGEKLNESNISNIIETIRGKKGTSVNITINRNNEELKFDVPREELTINPVESQMIDNDTGYVKYSSFDTKATKEFIEQTKKMKQDGMKNLILDLRNNGGGTLSACLEMASAIVPNGSTVMYQVDKNGNQKEEKTFGTPFLNDINLVVLIDEGTASASEVLTAMLKDYNLATVVGRKSYGKGVVQEILPLKQGDAVKLTISEYLTPNKNHIDKIGITPDYIVEIESSNTNNEEIDDQEQNLKQDKDVQKALEVFKK